MTEREIRAICRGAFAPKNTFQNRLFNLFLELSTFRISVVNILHNQGGGGGVRKDYTITGGRGDLQGPQKGLCN